MSAESTFHICEYLIVTHSTLYRRPISSHSWGAGRRERRISVKTGASMRIIPCAFGIMGKQLDETVA
jgi:hypothetical protein